MENTKDKREKYMKLYNIYFICKSCLPVLEKVSLTENRNGNGSLIGYIILNWGECRRILPELRKIKCLEAQIDKVCSKLNFVSFEKEKPEVTIETGKEFLERLQILYNSLNTIISLYESMEVGESNCGIDVKIPRCDSLKEYMDYLKEIDFIFSQCPYLRIDDDEIKFKNTDVGSQWLSFAVGVAGGFGILNNLAKLLERAIAMKSYLKTIKQQDEILKTMQLKNEVAGETIEVFKKMKRMTMEGYVDEIETELGELNNGEERGKVEKSLEKLVMLIDKGVEIYSSIEAPNEVKALFPMSENNILLPDNIVKLLEMKEDENAE